MNSKIEGMIDVVLWWVHRTGRVKRQRMWKMSSHFVCLLADGNEEIVQRSANVGELICSSGKSGDDLGSLVSA